MIYLRNIIEQELPAFRQANIDAMVAGLTFYQRSNENAIVSFCENQIDTEIQYAQQSETEIILSVVNSESDEVVGSLWYRLHQEPVYSDLVYIVWIGVYSEYRTKGYAKAAINAIAKELKPQGIHRMALQAFNNNLESINLYKSCGFQAKRTIMHKYL